MIDCCDIELCPKVEGHLQGTMDAVTKTYTSGTRGSTAGERQAIIAMPTGTATNVQAKERLGAGL